MRKSRLFVCGLLAVVGLVSVAGATYLPGDIAILSTENPTLQEIKDAETVGEIDSLLYPGGMQLPVKYADPAMYYLEDCEVKVPVDTAEFLQEYFPLNTRAGWTNAEVVTARIWVAANRIPDGSLAGDMFSEYLTAIGCTSVDTGYTIYPGSVDSVVDWCTRQVTIDGGPVTDTGSPISYGFQTEFDFGDLDDNNFAEYWSERLPFVEGLGCAGAASEVIYDPLIFYTKDSSEKAGSGGVASQGSAGASEGKHTDIQIVEVDLPALFQGSEDGEQSSQTEEKPPKVVTLEPGERSEYVDSFASGIEGEDTVTNKHYGFTDVVLYASVTLVCVAAIVFGVLDWRKKRNDPLRKYPRWR